MQRITFLSLAFITGLCIQSPALLAQDQDSNQKDRKAADSSHFASKKAPKVAKQDQKGAHLGSLSAIDKSSGKNGVSTASAVRRSTKIAKQSGGAASQGVQQTTQRQTRYQASAVSVKGTRGNRYDGNWSEADSHSDWDRNVDHDWDHHHYRWHDGGWLIVEAGPAADYSSQSVESNVQERLSQQGYYNGVIDGDIGPGTRHAISHYQSDNNLRVNGRIDGPLLASLGLN